LSIVQQEFNPKFSRTYTVTIADLITWTRKYSCKRKDKRIFCNDWRKVIINFYTRLSYLLLLRTIV